MGTFRNKFLPLIAFIAGIFLIVTYFFGEQFLTSIPKKSELTKSAGQIEWVKRASKNGRDVRFKLKNKEAFVHNGFGRTLAEELYNSLTTEYIVEVLADHSQPQKPMMHKFTYYPVYEIVINGKKIYAYESEIATIKRASIVVLLVGIFFVIYSVWYYRKHKKRLWFKT
ncbi:hypothetical protein [Pseudoalteromonas prydzensis]|uniref:hypothetical protein n=1 Tax=Pseudoalteromonas prydzensis TaxID=182141 RepID=UPI0007E4EAD7|nr:hypothetical protein [Pseudoalteromonas prydzensis]MBE0378810.1 hypothetical protein [Pseudoalteromonas prydzensis ACAM 620]